MAELAVMDATGDTKHIWDKNNDAEVEAAKALFTSLRKRGYLIYRVDKKGDKGEMLTEFDPNAEKLIASPPMVGG